MVALIDILEAQLPEAFAVGYISGFGIAAVIYAIRAAVTFFVRTIRGRD